MAGRCAGCEVKSQRVRLFDVFFLGPLMVWGGYALDQRGHKLAGPALSLLGLTTVVYNARNHGLVEARRR
jgi:hypothetical protein